MTFNIYLPTKDDEQLMFFYTSIEANSEREAEEMANNMRITGEIPEHYPY